MKRKSGQAARRLAALACAAAALLSAGAAARGISLPEAGALGTALLKSQLPLQSGAEQSAPLGFLTALTIHDSALLMAARAEIGAAGEGAAEPDGTENTETHEGTVIDPSEGETPALSEESDNGVAAKTIHPTNPAGYLVWKNVYITNTSNYVPDLNTLMQSRPAAVFTDEMPQILILHTHGSEAYTMPEGQEYAASGESRTLDTEYNVVRVGDEIASVFEEHGISVLHDRTLYDAAGYNDAYDRADDAIQAYLQKYPSIHFVLDIHRDAIEDSAGTSYKVISQVDGKNAAQLSIVVGTDGSGAPHDHWEENLKLAVLLQQHLTERYPTLMRPMYLRNSRYNEHATTGSLLVEVGAAGNSLDEALYAARLFAEGAVEVFETLR